MGSQSHAQANKDPLLLHAVTAAAAGEVQFNSASQISLALLIVRSPCRVVSSPNIIEVDWVGLHLNDSHSGVRASPRSTAPLRDREVSDYRRYAVKTILALAAFGRSECKDAFWRRSNQRRLRTMTIAIAFIMPMPTCCTRPGRRSRPSSASVRPSLSRLGSWLAHNRIREVPSASVIVIYLAVRREK